MLLQQTSQPSALVSLAPFVVILVIFYFILIRPGTNRQKKLQQMIDNLKVGDKIITNSGIYGTIMGFRNERIQVRVADNVKIDMARNAVAALQNPEEE